MMSEAFFVLAAAAAIAAAVAATVAYRRVHRHEIRRGRISSFSEIAPGAPRPNALVASHMFLPTLILAGAAALPTIIAALLLHFEKS
jgi:hypothetical protein